MSFKVGTSLQNLQSGYAPSCNVRMSFRVLNRTSAEKVQDLANKV